MVMVVISCRVTCLEFCFNDAVVSIPGGVVLINPNQVFPGAKENPEVVLVVKHQGRSAGDGLATGGKQLYFLPKGIVIVIIELPQRPLGVTCVDQIKIAVIITIHRNWLSYAVVWG